MTNKQGRIIAVMFFSSLSTLIHSPFSHLLQANCPMNLDGEHLCLNKYMKYLTGGLFFFSLLQQRTPVRMLVTDVVVVIIVISDAHHFSYSQI